MVRHNAEKTLGQSQRRKKQGYHDTVRYFVYYVVVGGSAAGSPTDQAGDTRLRKKVDVGDLGRAMDSHIW